VKLGGESAPVELTVYLLGVTLLDSKCDVIESL
jgi:hypothetical protein